MSVETRLELTKVRDELHLLERPRDREWMKERGFGENINYGFSKCGNGIAICAKITIHHRKPTPFSLRQLFQVCLVRNAEFKVFVACAKITNIYYCCKYRTHLRRPTNPLNKVHFLQFEKHQMTSAAWNSFAHYAIRIYFHPQNMYAEH